MAFDLDEMIKKENELYEYNKKIVDTHIVFEDVLIEQMYCDDTEAIEEALEKYRYATEYHKQIYEFLKLLKWYQQGMEDIPDESGVLPKDVYSAGYNKALEDFKEAIDKEDREEPLVLDMFAIEEIAEKLKK